VASDHDPLANALSTGYTRPGFAADYHRYRPRPPAALFDLVMRLARATRPDLVVDLGSGTGLSTEPWAARARQVVGVEPIDEMRAIAEATAIAPNVRYVAAVAQHTGLPDAAADIVTCSQSLHHLEPESTLREVGRLLRPGGTFAAYDYDWPPAVHPEAERALAEFLDRARGLRRARGIASGQEQWDKADHLARMQRSGMFRSVEEIALQNEEPCTAERWVGFALSLGHVIPLLDLDPVELGLPSLREAAERAIGDAGLPWRVTYRVRVGVK